jgi:hypothetical protein
MCWVLQRCGSGYPSRSPFASGKRCRPALVRRWLLIVCVRSHTFLCYAGDRRELLQRTLHIWHTQAVRAHSLAHFQRTARRRALRAVWLQWRVGRWRRTKSRALLTRHIRVWRDEIVKPAHQRYQALAKVKAHFACALRLL